MKFLLLVTFLCTGCSCTFSVTPLPTHRMSQTVHSTAKATHTVTKAKFVTVDADWLEHYTQMERQTNYMIRGDDQIKSIDGKFRVPQSVIDHYSDMQKAKPETKKVEY